MEKQSIAINVVYNNSVKLRLPVKDQTITIKELKQAISERLNKKNSNVEASELIIKTDDSFELDDEDQVGDHSLNDKLIKVSSSQQHSVSQSNIHNVPLSLNVSSSNVSLNTTTSTQVNQQVYQISTSKISNSLDMFVPPRSVSQEEEMKVAEADSKEFNLRYTILQGAEALMEAKVLKVYKDVEELFIHDLVEIVLKKEGYDVTKYRGALFDEKGVPLTENLASQCYTKCKDLIKEDQLVFIVLAPFYIDDIAYSATDPHIGKTQVFCMYNNKTHVVRVDLESSTVHELKQKIFSKIEVPTCYLSLSYGGKLMSKDHESLTTYNVAENSNININIIQGKNPKGHGYDSNFYAPHLNTTIEQSKKGIREFRSTLYVLVKRIESAKINKLLGYLREISGNDTALISALYHIYQRATITYTEKIALHEGFFRVFVKLLRTNKQISDIILSDASKIFEYSREVFTFIVEAINKNEAPEKWLDIENFKDYDFQCALTFKEIESLVGLLYDDGTIKCVELQAVKEKIIAKVQIPGIAELNDSKIVQLPKEKYLHKILKNLKLSKIFVWEPKVPFNSNELSSLVKNSEMNEAPAIYTQKCDAHSFFKYIPALSLKSFPENPSLTKDKFGETVLYVGNTKSVQKPIELLDLETGQTYSESADDLAGTTSTSTTVTPGQVKDEIVIRREPKEAIVVLVDISSSMSTIFGQEGNVRRIDAVKSFFTAFAERSMAYDFKHVISLVLFNSNVDKRCNFTEVFKSFIDHVQLCTPNGTTKLYDAIHVAVSMLNDLKVKYPKVIKRIICLSDGEDVGSYIKADEVAKEIQQNDIVFDSFIVGPNCDMLKCITFAANGCCFCPDTLETGIKLFEWETVLRVGIREQQAKKNIVTCGEDLEQYKSTPFDKQPHFMKQPQKLTEKVANPSQILNVAAKNAPHINSVNQVSVFRVKRVLKELHSLIQNPHPCFEVYPCEKDLSFWRILLKGPETTPYEGGVFYLYAKFPDTYPTKPPEMRFITPIYHCNINSNGRICHSIFARNYTIDTSVRLMFDCIYGLLLTPEPDDPLDNAIAQEYYSTKEIYLQKAKDGTKTNASKTIPQYLEEFLGQEYKDSKSVEASAKHPDHFVDPLTMELMEEPVLCLSSKKVFEKKVITKYMQEHGQDPFTLQPISEKDLVPMDNLIDAIQEYKKGLQIQDAWFLK